jgi:hypothetical protein
MSNPIIDRIVEAIEIPDTSYDLANKRYIDLGEWINRENSSCADHGPIIRPQGSFRFGTVIRPINNQDEYDLDMSCIFEKGISRTTHTQEQIKVMLGNEIEAYRKYRGIEEEKEEKHRCWRLSYKDQMKFHLDVVPCIPDEASSKEIIANTMTKYGVVHEFAESIAISSVAITDNRHPNYRILCNDWKISNPEGYAQWFESRMKLVERTFMEKVAGIDELPTYKWKTPLQRCVQILKRHRDVMFAQNIDLKPSSIIITTLAANAYNGESNVEDAVKNILTKIKGLINPTIPRIPNPVDHREDFADRWSMECGRTLKLEQNFFNWIDQAISDFNIIDDSRDAQFIEKQAMQKYSISLDVGKLVEALKVNGPSTTIRPKLYNIDDAAPKPWQNI